MVLVCRREEKRREEKRREEKRREEKRREEKRMLTHADMPALAERELRERNMERGNGGSDRRRRK